MNIKPKEAFVQKLKSSKMETVYNCYWETYSPVWTGLVAVTVYNGNGFVNSIKYGVDVRLKWYNVWTTYKSMFELFSYTNAPYTQYVNLMSMGTPWKSRVMVNYNPLFGGDGFVVSWQ